MNDNLVYKEGASVVVSSEVHSTNIILYSLVFLGFYYFLIEHFWAYFRTLLCVKDVVTSGNYDGLYVRMQACRELGGFYLIFATLCAWIVPPLTFLVLAVLY